LLELFIFMSASIFFLSFFPSFLSPPLPPFIPNSRFDVSSWRLYPERALNRKWERAN
jgi:hypothetical protein